MLKVQVQLHYRAFITIAALFCSYAISAETVNPHTLLMEMERNTRALTYQGTLVYNQGRHMETLQLFHTNIDGQQRERLVHLTGMPREIIRHGDKVMCIHPKNGVMTLNNTIPAGPFANYRAQLQSVDEPYRVALAGQGRVAGREVNILAVEPKDAYRYGYRLALDKETSLLLQSLMVDEQNRVLERFEYTEIRFGGTLSAEQLNPQFDRKSETWALLDVSSGQPLPVTASTGSTEMADHTNQAAKRWNVGWVPKGFAMSSSRQDKPQSAAKDDKMRDSLMYSDGLTAFSVFIAPNVDMRSVAVQSGATTAYTAVKKDDAGVFSVTVVGEIPRIAAKTIAGSVDRKATP